MQKCMPLYKMKKKKNILDELYMAAKIPDTLGERSKIPGRFFGQAATNQGQISGL